MEGWQYLVVWLVTVLGAVLGGVLGWWQKDAPFNWRRCVFTLISGLIAGGLWLVALRDMHAVFGGGSLVAGAVLGMGFDFLVKKLPSAG